MKLPKDVKLEDVMLGWDSIYTPPLHLSSHNVSSPDTSNEPYEAIADMLLYR